MRKPMKYSFNESVSEPCNINFNFSAWIFETKMIIFTQIDLFSYDLVLLPVHLGMHWCLACIDFRNHQIQYYDSLKGNNTQCLYVLRYAIVMY